MTVVVYNHRSANSSELLIRRDGISKKTRKMAPYIVVAGSEKLTLFRRHVEKSMCSLEDPRPLPTPSPERDFFARFTRDIPVIYTHDARAIFT